MWSHAFNGLSILYHVTLYHPIKLQESTLVLDKRVYESFLPPGVASMTGLLYSPFMKSYILKESESKIVLMNHT